MSREGEGKEEREGGKRRGEERRGREKNRNIFCCKIKISKNMALRGWRDGSAVESTDCSSIPGFEAWSSQTYSQVSQTDQTNQLIPAQEACLKSL